MLEALKSLLRSRKFLLTVVAVLQTVLLQYFQIDPEIWQAIDALLLWLIGMITLEDYAAKRSGRFPPVE